MAGNSTGREKWSGKVTGKGENEEREGFDKRCGLERKEVSLDELKLKIRREAGSSRNREG